MTLMSMTGFGRGRFSLGPSSFRLEVRTVNHRFLDVRARLPWSDAELESRVSGKVRARLTRGRVDLTVEEEGGAGGGALKLNETMAASLAQVLGELSFSLSCELDTAAALIPPPRGLVYSSAAGNDTDEIWAALEACLDEALDGLVQMRATEGAAHVESLGRHLSRVEDVGQQVKEISAREPANHQARLEQRLQRLSLKHDALDPARVAQEVALLADRCDVSEELDRLCSHLVQMKEVFASDEPAGRKIEFLLQELHRELNTAGSKTREPEASHLLVEAKAAVEKMRELALNIE